MYLRNYLKHEDGRLKRIKYWEKSILDQVIAPFPSVSIWGPTLVAPFGLQIVDD